MLLHAGHRCGPDTRADLGLRRCVHQLANSGIQPLSSIEQLEPQEAGSDEPASLATLAAVASLLKPAVAVLGVAVLLVPT